MEEVRSSSGRGREERQMQYAGIAEMRRRRRKCGDAADGSQVVGVDGHGWSMPHQTLRLRSLFYYAPAAPAPAPMVSLAISRAARRETRRERGRPRKKGGKRVLPRSACSMYHIVQSVKLTFAEPCVYLPRLSNQSRRLECRYLEQPLRFSLLIIVGDRASRCGCRY